MRRPLAMFVAAILLVGAVNALAAGKAKIKWVTSVYSDSDGVGLKYPEGVACGNDFLVVSDTGNRRIVRYSYEGPIVTEKEVIPVPRSYPMTLQVSSRGDLYFLDGKERRVARLDLGGEEKEFVNPKGLPAKKEVVVRSFRIGPDDNLYLLDVFSSQVIVMDPEGRILRRVPAPAEHGYFTDLAVNWQGRIFLVDGVTGIVYTAGPEADAFSPFTESLKELLNFPTYIEVDERGTVYLVDQHGSGLGLVGSDGEFIGRRLGLGWNESGLYYPAQLCISKSGNVFIADRNNSRVQMFSIERD